MPKAEGLRGCHKLVIIYFSFLALSFIKFVNYIRKPQTTEYRTLFPMNILTFDIEDWFHTHQNRQDYSGHIWKDLPSKVEFNTGRILDMLGEHDLKATFFVLGWVGEHYPDLVKQIHSQGHEIAAHSHWHHNPQFLSPESFEKDVKLCLSTLQNIIGEKITAYRAPGFNLKINDKWAFEILLANGIEVDSSVELWKIPKNIPVIIETPENKILEFPLIRSTFGIPYSGGGYFRALPQSYINYLIKKHEYNLLYFHPRDFDSENPYTNLFSFFRNWLNRLNTGKCKNNLNTILLNNKTHTLKQAVDKYKKNSLLHD